MTVELRFYGDLAEVAGEARFDAPFGEPRSVKDLIESYGVPHTEVALVVVDGRGVGFDHRIHDGERVAVYPPFHSLDLAGARTVAPRPIAPRFVLDVHLGTLTRRLRWLGFDCWYETDADDVTLAEVAVDDERILLTRDRQLLMRRQLTHGYLPRSQDPDTQTLEVVRRFRLSDALAPGTRCVGCNGEVVEADLDEVAARVPPRSRAAFDRFGACRRCGQLYWAGSHADALADLLAEARTVGLPTGAHPPPQPGTD